MKITHLTHDEFIETVVALTAKGIQFDADGNSLTITICGF